MGGGGSASAMAQSVKNNLALRRKRKRIFDRKAKGAWSGTGEKQVKSEVPAQVRERFRAQLEEERRKDKRWLYGQVCLIVGVIAALVYFL